MLNSRVGIPVVEDDAVAMPVQVFNSSSRQLILRFRDADSHVSSVGC